LNLRRRWRKRKPKPGEVIVSAVVHRKDGTTEDLGVIGRSTLQMKPEAK